MIVDQGYGETEPNDHKYSADGLLLGRFYHGNSSSLRDEDWYYLVTRKPNQKLNIYFLGSPENFNQSQGWLVQVSDVNGNPIASFDTTRTDSGGDDSPEGGNGDSGSPVDNAKMSLLTLPDAATYYISVKPMGDSGGQLRGYNIALTLQDTGQPVTDPGGNYFDTETEPNDGYASADPLRSGVVMKGMFDRTLEKYWVEPKPPEYEIGYFYKLCNSEDIGTYPPGALGCSCDLTASPFPSNPNFDPVNPDAAFDIDPTRPGIQLPADPEYDPNYQCPPVTDPNDPNDPHYCNYTKAQVESIPLPLIVPVDAANPPLGWPANYTLSAGASCEAMQIQKPGTGTDSGIWKGRFNYDPDYYAYKTDIPEQLRIQVCVQTECEFKKAHLKVEQAEAVLMDGPIAPGQTIDLGTAEAGEIYFILTPEPEDGPKVDPETGEETVIDLTGPYDLLLQGTRLAPHGNQD